MMTFLIVSLACGELSVEVSDNFLCENVLAFSKGMNSEGY